MIGKQGRTARSIRTILGAAGMKLTGATRWKSLSKACTADWVTVAVLVRPRGVRGEITAVSQSSHPERFAQSESRYACLDRAVQYYQSSASGITWERWFSNSPASIP